MPEGEKKNPLNQTLDTVVGKIKVQLFLFVIGLAIIITLVSVYASGVVIYVTVLGFGAMFAYVFMAKFPEKGEHNTQFIDRNAQREAALDLSELSGTWYGVHLSRNARGPVISRHIYNLKVSPFGEINGTCNEEAEETRYQYIINGAVRLGGIFLYANIRDTPSYAWFFNMYNQNNIPGFIYGCDFEKNAFASHIILSRDRKTDKAFLDSMEEYKNRFYLSK